jgi:hypothetical protein
MKTKETVRRRAALFLVNIKSWDEDGGRVFQICRRRDTQMKSIRTDTRIRGESDVYV